MFYRAVTRVIKSVADQLQHPVTIHNRGVFGTTFMAESVSQQPLLHAKILPAYLNTVFFK